MFEKAKKNLDEEKLILGDMTNFDLETNFDVVLCNNNSINHLLSLEDWEKFFDMTYKHLKKD
jgi:SAM-dependent methyltransferase